MESFINKMFFCFELLVVFRGKIVFSPDVPVIRGIMEKIKMSLSPPNMHIMEFQKHIVTLYPNLTLISANVYNMFEVNFNLFV